MALNCDKCDGEMKTISTEIYDGCEVSLIKCNKCGYETSW